MQSIVKMFPLALHKRAKNFQAKSLKRHERTKEAARVRLRNQFLGIACLTAAAQACALTLGTPQNPVVLGAPLDVRITIVPDPGQTLDSSCIQAQVMQGEVFTPVRTTLIAPQTLRIRSQ